MELKAIGYGIVIGLVLILVLVNLGFMQIGSAGIASGNMPEKCKVPAGQDVASWKEHLGHHADTQECLKYF
jgi:hypothetical protein